MVGSHDEGGRTVSIQTSNEGSLYRCFVGCQLAEKLVSKHATKSSSLLQKETA